MIFSDEEMSSVYKILRAGTVNLIFSIVNPSGNIETDIATGFFIDDTHVVTVAHAVLTKLARQPVAEYYLTRVERIIGTVKVQDSAYVVNLNLIGLSPINDVAVLEVVNPPSHSSLKFVDSSQVVPGTEVYVIGDLLNRDVRALSSGVLRDNRMIYGGAPLLPALLDANISIGGGISGSPIVTSSGSVVGMVSFTLNWLQNQGYFVATGTTIGPTSETIQQIVNDILANKNVVNVNDTFGDWLHWQMPGLNATFNYVQPLSMLTAINGISVDALNKPLPFTTNDGVFVLDTTASQVSGLVNVNDDITHINGQAIGYLSSSQSSIGEILKKLSIGDSVTMVVRTAASNYQSTETVNATLAALSPSYDVIYSNAQILSTSYQTRSAQNLGSNDNIQVPTIG